MADLMAALRNAHKAGDTAAATRIAGMIKAQQQAPTGAATPTPTASPSLADQAGDVLAGMGRITAGAISDVANVPVGLYNALGSGIQSVSNAITGENAQFTPMAPAGYGEWDKYLAPRGTGEQIVASLPSYMVGGEFVAPVKAAANAGRITRAATSVLNQLPAAITGELAEHNQGDISAGNIAANAVLPAVVEKVGGAAVRGVRNLLPENYGGYSTAQQAARVVAPEALERTLQGGNVEAQQAYRTATTDAQGNSILLPSQVFNNQAGDRYIAAESRDMLRGTNSEYNQRLAAQQSGESIEQAVANANAGAVPIQESAQNITGQFKKQASKLYNDSKQNAQDILDTRYVTELHMNNTKDLANQHLLADAQAGRINLNAETRRTLSQLQNTKFDNISTLDNWKRALNEKASKAYRNGDYQSSTTLREVLNNLRGEADATIQSIDPAAGSIYRDADKYFSESVGDFGAGKKSVLGKIADKANPVTAANALVRGQDAAFNATNIGDALQGAINTGSLDDAATLATEFGSSLGATTRETALNAANTGANFSPTKFANTLNRLDPQANIASRFAADEQAVNDALADAVGQTRLKARSTGRITNAIGSGAGRVVGAGVGGAVGTVFGGAAGAAAGAVVGERISKAIGEGMLDRIVGTNRNAAKYIQFLSDPANAKTVSDILANQGGLNAPVEAIVHTVNALTQSGYSNLNTSTVQPTYQAPAPIEAEPVQRAQAAKATPSNASTFEPKVTKLYKALAHAETGGLQDRFIRTKAAEAGVSTAYGAAQLTVTTAKDFYKRHPDVFTPEEKAYLGRFFEQGENMKRAAKNDPVYGYGGSGVLNGKEDRKLYANVVRKMLNRMIQDNGGSLDKTVKQWRGNNNDHAYFSKVRAAYQGA